MQSGIKPDFTEADELESLRLQSNAKRDVDNENFSVSFGLGPTSNNRILNRSNPKKAS